MTDHEIDALNAALVEAKRLHGRLPERIYFDGDRVVFEYLD